MNRWPAIAISTAVIWLSVRVPVLSELMAEVFGEDAGVGTRSAVGMGSLPGNIPVGLVALLVGTAIGWIGGFMSVPDVTAAAKDIAIGLPTLQLDLLLSNPVPRWQIIASKFATMAVGLVSALPYLVALGAMALWARHVDNSADRFGNVAWPCAVAFLGLVAGQIDGVALHPEDVFLARKQKSTLNLLVQLVDVLRDQREQLPSTLEFHDRLVRHVRSGVPRR